MHDPAKLGTGNFRLQLGDKFPPVNSIEGGGAVGVIVSGSDTPPTPPFLEKHLRGIRYEPLVVTTSFGSAPPLFQWIQASWRGTLVRKNGAVISLDARGRPVAQREFVNAVVAETTVPTLDTASRDDAIVTVQLAPQRTSDVDPPPSVPPPGTPAGISKASNFKLDIAGLDCTRVSRIESFTVKQQPNRVDVPNLRIALSPASAESWRTWFRTFVLEGTSSAEKEGSLELLDTDLTTVLATIRFHKLGIFRLEGTPPTAERPRVVAELYCERMELTLGSEPS